MRELNEDECKTIVTVAFIFAVIVIAVLVIIVYIPVGG